MHAVEWLSISLTFISVVQVAVNLNLNFSSWTDNIFDRMPFIREEEIEKP